MTTSSAVPPIGRAELREALDTLRRYKAGKSNLERRIIENEEFWKLRHWEHIPEQGTSGLKTKSAWLVNVLLSKHADAMDAYPEPAFLPRAADDEAEAALLSQVVPVILAQNDFAGVWSDNWWKKLKAGVAFYGVFWDRDKLNGLGDVSIIRVDPLNLFWEPGVTDLQRSRNLFHVELADNDALLERYPVLEGRLRGGGFTASRYLYDESVDTSRKTPVIDWYYKKREGNRTVLHYVKFVGETLLYSTENEAAGASARNACQSGAVGDSRRSQALPQAALPASEPLRGALSAQAALPATADPQADALERGQALPQAALSSQALAPVRSGLYDHGLYPFFADVLFPEEGTPAGFGYVDLCKDAQRQIDLMNNAIVANCVAAATPRWLKRGDDGINESEYADWSRPFVHVQGSIEENALRQITVAPLSGNYLHILSSKINEIKETSGNRDVNNGGVGGGVTAASAIAALQEQSGKLSRDQIQNAYRCFRQVVACVIALIRQFYDTPRKLRITGADGEAAYLSFDNRLLAAGEGTELDIEVSAQRQSVYNKLSYNEMAMQFFQMGFFRPELADQALAALEMMDFKGKEAMRRRLAENGSLQARLAQSEAMLERFRSLIAPQQGQDGAARPAAGRTDKPRRQAPTLKRNSYDSLGAELKRNAILEKARARSAAATQPR